MLVRPALIALTATLVLAGCSGSDDEPSTASDPAPTTGVSCEYGENGQPPATEVDPPSDLATETGEVAATVQTSAGEIGLTLDAEAAPCTVHSFVSLAEQGYFDGTTCHRLVTSGIQVLQCGDPSATGGGGPGYSFPDELTGEETYPAGTLAMANAGPDTNGSQFFFVYGETPLGPDYTVFGAIDDAGLKVLEEIAAGGTANGAPDGPPAQPVTIESVMIG
jgi:peptidyl-prolyl cis-trans isomerase B (cyclophilin B)